MVYNGNPLKAAARAAVASAGETTVSAAKILVELAKQQIVELANSSAARSLNDDRVKQTFFGSKGVDIPRKIPPNTRLPTSHEYPQEKIMILLDIINKVLPSDSDSAAFKRLFGNKKLSLADYLNRLIPKLSDNRAYFYKNPDSPHLAAENADNDNQLAEAFASDLHGPPPVDASIASSREDRKRIPYYQALLYDIIDNSNDDELKSKIKYPKDYTPLTQEERDEIYQKIDVDFAQSQAVKKGILGINSTPGKHHRGLDKKPDGSVLSILKYIFEPITLSPERTMGFGRPESGLVSANIGGVGKSKKRTICKPKCRKSKKRTICKPKCRKSKKRTICKPKCRKSKKRTICKPKCRKSR